MTERKGLCEGTKPFLISEKIRGTAIGDKFDAVQNITLSSYLYGNF